MEDTSAAFTLMELFRMGGIIMWPLLFFSIATVAITVERAVYFLYHDLTIGGLKEKAAVILEASGKESSGAEAAEAKVFLESRSGRAIAAAVFLAMVKHSALSERRLEKTVEAEAARSLSSLESGFNLLTALASLSPLTGFLGTVTGMISAFRSIAEAAEVNAQIVAGGIYEALITTVFGLIIAIVAMSAHSIFTSISDKFASELELACSDLIVELSESRVVLGTAKNEN